MSFKSKLVSVVSVFVLAVMMILPVVASAQFSGGGNNSGGGFTGGGNNSGGGFTGGGNNSGGGGSTTTRSSGGGGGGKRIFQCNDGLDNDGDGEIDFPGDLGCSNPRDDTEDTDQIRVQNGTGTVSLREGSVHLTIRNDVSLGGDYVAADSPETGLVVDGNSNVVANYMVTVMNSGDGDAGSVEFFTVGLANNGTSSHGIANVRGARYLAGTGTFIIPEVPAGEARTVTFSVVLMTPENADVYNQYTEISDFSHEAGEEDLVSGLGAANSAYLMVRGVDGTGGGEGAEIIGGGEVLSGVTTLPTSGGGGAAAMVVLGVLSGGVVVLLKKNA